jgi:hypothetical protein
MIKVVKTRVLDLYDMESTDGLNMTIKYKDKPLKGIIILSLAANAIKKF